MAGLCSCTRALANGSIVDAYVRRVYTEADRSLLDLLKFESVLSLSVLGHIHVAVVLSLTNCSVEHSDTLRTTCRNETEIIINWFWFDSSCCIARVRFIRTI